MSVPRYWREIPYHFRLVGSICKSCGAKYIPPSQRCLNCNSSDIENKEFPRTGKVITYTIVYTPPAGFKILKPYIIALVELDNGAKLLSQITDCDPDEVFINMPVEAVFRRISSDGTKGIVRYGYKFRPVMQKKEST